MKKLTFTAASRWVVSGLDICPENAGAGTYETGRLVEVQSTCSDITVQNSIIKGALDITDWTTSDWQTRLTKTSYAIYTAGPRTTIVENTFENVGFGIVVTKTAPYALVSGNTITAFYNDGIRGLADDCIFEYNTVQDSYVSDSNHDDFFQSWSTDSSGTVGNGTVYRVTLRGNFFISRRDPSQALYAPPQGIGGFDGMFEDWVIENNVIATRTYHGISLYGAINCKIVNNTVVENPLDESSTVRPWIYITSHKNSADGTSWPVPSSGNVVRNNISSRSASVVEDGGVADHNQTTTSYASYFADYDQFNFRLLNTAPAVDAGETADAPTIDIRRKSRTVPYDLGAYECGSAIYEGFDFDPTTNISTAPDSPSDTGWIGETWTGSNDIVSPGLSFSGLSVAGNALQFYANIGSARVIDMTTFPTDYTQVDSDSVTRLGRPGTTVWVRFLIRADAEDPAGSLIAGLGLNGSTTGGTLKLRIGDVGAFSTWGLIKGNTVGSSSTQIVTGDTVLLVTKIKFVTGSNNDEVDLFVNPPGSLTPPETPSATLRNLDIGTFDRLEVKGTRKTTIDEIVVARSWDAL